MNKKMIVMTAAALAAAMVASTAAEARGGRGFAFRIGGHSHDRFWSGIKPTFNHRERDEDTYHERRRYKPAVRHVAPVEQVSPVRYADGKGRQFDRASLVWFDGKSQCFTGDKPFVFKSGSWFYGKARWFEANGVWQTAAADAPVAADCMKVPMFAAKLAPVEKPPKVVQKPAEPVAEKAKVPAVKTAEKVASDRPAGPAKAAECKKYFPSVGESLPVPCTE